MTKIDIVSGFLGAGKTTLIKKLIEGSFSGQKVVLIENEFGEIGIDGGFMKDSGIEITEMNSGCICCSLVGDFGKALIEVLEKYSPDRIIIEPSGVGKLSDVIKAVKKIEEKNKESVSINSAVTVCDVLKCRLYMDNFGEFYNNQIESAGCIVLSRTQNASEKQLLETLQNIREKNAGAPVITTPWDELTSDEILEVIEEHHELALEVMKKVLREHRNHEDDDWDEGAHHHHRHDDEEEECRCHHDEDGDEDVHHHHHHDDEEEECGCHHDEDGHHRHYGDEDEECGCHHDEDGHHHHHHDHDADEIFESFGVETPKSFEKDELERILKALSEDTKYGVILRSKGIVRSKSGEWIHFDMVPGEYEIRTGSADYTGRLCVIGSKLNEDAIKQLFGV